MIDFHSHILPAIDDGSHNTEESLQLIKGEISQNVSKIFVTPHFYADRASIEHFLDKREDRYQKLCKSLESLQFPIDNLYVGAEVYYFKGIGKADLVPLLCVKGTNILLLEMPFCQWTKDMLEDIELLLNKKKIHLILAHVERYISYQKNKDIWNAVMQLPLVMQVNAGSLLKWPKNKKSLNLLKQNDNIVLGSDCHNLTSRVPNLAAGREVIAHKIGPDCLKCIDDLGERILQEWK